MTDPEQPEQWAVEASQKLFDEILSNMGGYAEFGQPSYKEGAMRSIQRAFTERTADLVAENAKLREALRACRRAISHGAEEPRRNVREIVEEALAQDKPDAK